jgi:hypothetical protein
MAPTSPVKRVTRARAAAKTTAAEPAPKKLGTSKVTKSTTTKTTAAKPATRKTRTTDNDLDDEVIEAEPPKKTTRTTTKAAPLAVAPRRRLKVTPLNTTAAEQPSELEKETAKAPKKTTTRSKKAADPQTTADELADPAPAKTRTRTTKSTTDTSATTKKAATKADDAATPPAKPRGRPKKTAQPVEEAPKQIVTAPTTRQTRARSGSIASQVPAEVIDVATKPKTGPRKKVTFQDVSEDEKENETVAPKRAAAKKAVSATGMRAKPVRKATAATATRTAPTRGKASKSQTRVLTPKKITQVRHISTPDSSEDELSNGKDLPALTASPKRSAAVAAQLSSPKKTNLTHSALISPQKPSNGAILLSPARRPASPAKDSTADAPTSPSKASPRRVDIFGTGQEIAAAALMPPNTHSLLQSPKRGGLHAPLFPESAAKTQRSPFKESLLQSPARRLFSPVKQKTPLSVHRDTENDTPMADIDVTQAVSASSHFRTSMSPKRGGRVYRMSDEELADELSLDVDFDQSLLKLTSPKKSPAKRPLPVLTEALDIEPEMPALQNDSRETAIAVEDLQYSEDNDELLTENAREQEETVEPAQMSIADDVSQNESDDEQVTVQQPARGKGKSTRLSQVLFRASQFREDDTSSEDELAVDETPDRAPRLFRSSMTGNNPRSRLSTLMAQGANKNVGFTPLAAKMSGWLATSPDKSPPKSAKKQQTPGLFSPVAAQHVAGEIQISRNSTPQRYKSSPGFRSSVTSRPSLAVMGSPEKSSFFAEQMSAMSHDLQAHDDEGIDEGIDEVATEDIAADITAQADVAAENAVIMSELEHMADDHVDETMTDDDTVIVNKHPEELTTDLVNEVHASDTAMVEFQDLAKEAESLADFEDDEPASTPESEYGDENAAPEDSTLHLSIVDHDSEPVENSTDACATPRVVDVSDEQTLNLHVLEQVSVEEDDADTPQPARKLVEDEQTLNLHILEHNVRAQPSVSAEDEPTLHLDALEQRALQVTPQATQQVATEDQTLNLHVSEDNAMHITPSKIAINTPEGSPESLPSPVRAPVVTTSTPANNGIVPPRHFNTVVSKVPLKPAGGVSPIKMPKKRSRSMSMSRQQSPPKRPQLTPIGKLAARSTSYPAGSPDRAARSTAPSPAHTTPGQMSFAIDDFGDSTLDGIELPDEMDFEVGRPEESPATVKSVKTTKSALQTPSRTPLKAVGPGVLHGAVIYVEVRTGEGADASGVYIDLLTQMGAKCVRDWRWNPRASLGRGEDPTAANKIGITHVVYKDGAARTLEKVRNTKGEVWCVGVRWVLE